MKVNTVEQFKVLQFLKEQFELELFKLELFKLELLDRYSIQVTDSTGDKMVFKHENNKVVW